MHVTKLTVCKGVTLELAKKWSRAEFTIEIALGEKDDIETAKSICDTLLDSWIKQAQVRKA